MDQNSVLFLLSAIVQALAAVMAIVGTFMIFVYSLKWGKPPTEKTRRIWLGTTFGLAFLLLITISYALLLIPQIRASPELLKYREHIIGVQILAIIDFVVLFVYIALVHMIMHPKILSVNLRIMNLVCQQAFPALKGAFLIQNSGTDMARDVKIFMKLMRESLILDTGAWSLCFEAKGSPYIQPEGEVIGGIKMYRLENEYELFRGDLHAGDKDQCQFEVNMSSQGNFTLVVYLVDAYGFKSPELKYSWIHSRCSTVPVLGHFPSDSQC